MKKHSLLVIAITAVTVAFGQNVNKKGFYNEPIEFSEYARQDVMNGFYDGTTPLSVLNFNSERTWTVYSDRDNNLVFDRINGRESGEIDFMEPLYVKDIQGSWLQVVLKSNPKQDLGWINAEYLILSRYAVLSSGTSAPKKGMALMSFMDEGVTGSQLDNVTKGQYDYFSNPDRNTRSIIGKSNKFQIYFVLKETPSSTLLSLTDKISENKNQARSSVTGWMNEMHITGWDTRVCLEPSNQRRAVDDYTGKIIPVFPKERDLAIMYNRPDPTKGAIFKNVLSDYLLSPYIMRMPILEHIDSKNKKVATVGQINYEIQENKKNDFVCLEEIDKLQAKMMNINVVFVIDGTQSMNSFYQPVVSSITDFIDQGLDVSANVRFGSIIYRDYLDGPQAYNVYPLTDNYERIKKQLLNTPRVSADKDLPEAQYNGLVKGVPKVGFEEGQTNIIVLIGDAGNHEPDSITLDEVVAVLDPYDVNFIAFQVIQGTDYSYMTFNLDSKEYIKGVFANRKTEFTNEGGELIEHISNKNTFQFVMQDDIDITNLYGFGRFTYANMGEAMSTVELKKNIQNAIEENVEALTKKIVDLRAICGDGTTGTVGGPEYTEEVLRVLAKSLSESTGKSYEECIQILRNLKEFSFIGYTSTKFYSKRSQCYENVVYLTATEFDRLKKVLEDFYKGGNTTKAKIAFKDALSEQSKAILGSQVEQSYIDNLTLNEVWNITMNIPFDSKNKYGALRNTRIKDLVNTTNPDFEAFYQDFLRKCSNFGPQWYSDRSFKMGGTTHYWVPLNDFPGNG
jgi:hypothetical protein